MLVASLCILLVALEQVLCAVGELTGQTVVASLVHEEVAVAACGSLGIEGELAGLSRRIVAEEVPVAALDSLLHLGLAVGHAALDRVHLAGRVSNDDRRAGISLGFLDGLESLDHVCAHCDLCNVDIAVGHGDLGEGLGLDLLACCRELSDLADVGCLGCLTAGVGVDLGVEYENVDVFAGSENVVNAAEADVERPAVAAEDPAALLVQEVLLLKQLCTGAAAAVELFERSNEILGSCLVCFAAVVGLEPLCSLGNLVCDSFDLALEVIADLLLAEVKAEAVLCVIPNREFAQEGPLPSLLTVYGEVAAGPPQMELQPVALEIIM